MNLPPQYAQNLRQFNEEREMSPRDFEYIFGTGYSHKKANHALRAMYAEFDGRLKKQTEGRAGLQFKIISGGWSPMEEVHPDARKPHEFPVVKVLFLTPFVLKRAPMTLDDLNRDPV